MSYRPFFIYGDNAMPPDDDGEPPCTECGEAECACGESTYECDSCRRMVPVSEIHSVRNTSAGQGEFCDRCLGMDGSDEWTEGNALPEEGR